MTRQTDHEPGSGRRPQPARATAPGMGTAGRPIGTWLLTVGIVALAIAAVTLGTGNRNPVRPLANGVARTPPMGWNTWNTFGCTIDETLVKGMADAIVAKGLRDLGYHYVIVDDCWFDPQRDGAGDLRAAPSRFPSGMKALGDYLHALGLKFGLYAVPAGRTCAQYAGAYPGSTGSGGHEYQDARRFAAWGVDYLKYDWCSPHGAIDDQVRAFARMRDALAATGRPIVYSINPNSIHATTGPQRYWGDVANQWRTTQDITDAWDTAPAYDPGLGVRNIVDANVPLASYAAPGGFNDPDMLEVGRGGLSAAQTRSHFALWAMMAAPLIAGNDLRDADAATLAVLANPALVAIDQDALGLQATQVGGDASHRILVKRLSGGALAIALFNESDRPATISTSMVAAGLAGHAFSVVDAWTAAVTSSSGAVAADLPAHATAVYRVTPSG